jgi:hypothetical protein
MWDSLLGFVAALKEHAWGGGFIGIALSILVWIVSVLKPHKLAGNATAALLSALLVDAVAAIKRHRYALYSNCFLIAVLWAAFLAYADVKQQLINPITISFETDNIRPFLEFASEALWVRVRARNNSHQDVVCRVFLNRLEKKGEGAAFWAGEPLRLYWSGSEVEEPDNADRTIEPGPLGKIFNLAVIDKGANELRIQNLQFARQVPEKLSAGVYTFTVQATHSTCRSDPFTVSVQYKGQQNVAFVEPQPK